jgi:hypothetical protein
VDVPVVAQAGGRRVGFEIKVVALAVRHPVYLQRWTFHRLGPQDPLRIRQGKQLRVGEFLEKAHTVITGVATILNQTDVTQTFTSAGVLDLGNTLKFRNGTYAQLSQDYVMTDYVFWFNQWLDKWGLGTWEDWWKCDDFAQLFVAGMRICHKEAQDAALKSYTATLLAGEDNAAAIATFTLGQPQGPAMFEIWGVMPGNEQAGKHSFIAAVVDGGELIFIEPQETTSVKIYTMSEEDIAAIYLIV